MATLTLKGICKRFGHVTALSEVDLHVGDGEFCVLLGPSGCGKSTLLNIVAGLIPQDIGTVFLGDEPIDGLTPRDRDMAMVFQNYALYPHMTVAKNLGFGLRMRKTPKSVIHAQVLETAELLGIEDLLNRKPGELSGGQRQRVAMGRALVRRPRLFLLDEPLSNLDARLRAKVRLELKRLHRQIRTTTLYVTHDQVEAMTLGDTVVVMGEGKVRQLGTPEAIYSQPVDTFVATFIGSPEMNLYTGRLVVREGGPFFVGRGFSQKLAGLPIERSDGEWQIGFRPEDVHLTQVETRDFTATVEMVSNVGSESYIHARLGQEMLTLRAPQGISVPPGKLLNLAVDPGGIHLFRGGVRV